MRKERRSGRRRADDVVLMSEIATALGVHRVTAYHWARAGEIPGVKWRGGRFEMRREDLKQLRPVAA